MPDRARQFYEYPPGMIDVQRSPAFEAFCHYYVHDSFGLSRREVDLGFLRALTADEVGLARSFLRANLHTRHVHIVKGVADLEDRTCVPLLRGMLGDEQDASRRLVIAGSLWRLDRDQIFVDLLEDMLRSSQCWLIKAHQGEILWVADYRAIDLMIQTLTVSCRVASAAIPHGPLVGSAHDRLQDTVRDEALRTLCAIEDRRHLTADQLPRRDACAYLERRAITDFVEAMVRNLREWYLPDVFPEVVVR
ncbi:MAG: hypothetical protein NTV05_16060 [Acidobacteria bacterium]|nr:hypothetical protein [Acidobacteriota bacterium]